MGLFDTFGGKKKPGKREAEDFLETLLMEDEANMRTDAVSSDELPNAYGPFGLSETNPIPTRGIKESYEYISKLRTLDGRPFDAGRIGSTTAPEVTKACIDIYELSVDGQDIAIIYICPYHMANSIKVPEGFTLSR